MTDQTQTTFTIDLRPQKGRACGDCQLCCKLLPMKASSEQAARDTTEVMIAAGMIEDMPYTTPEFDKPAGVRCQHQRHHKGCAIYGTRPFGCRMWSCGWLQGEDLPRPDRCGYVVDTIPDTIRVSDEGLPETELLVAQVWVDPRTPDAHRDPRLREWINNKGCAALVRFNETDAVALFPPSMTGTGQWIERAGGGIDKTLGLQGAFERVWGTPL